MLKRLTLWTLTPLLLIALAMAPTAIINGAQLFPWDFGKIAINYITNTNAAPFTGWLGIELDDEQLSELTVHTGDDRGNDIIAINGTWNHPSDYIRAFNREPNQIFVYTEIPTGGRTEIDIYGANPNLNEPGGAPLASDDAPLITYTPAQPGQSQQFSTEITLEIPRDGTVLRPQQYRLSSESGVQLKVTPVTDESGTVTALNCECSAYTSGGDILYSTEQTLQQWLAVDGYTRTVLVDKLVDYTATVEQQITEDYTATIVVPGPNIGQIVKEHFVIYEELTGFLYDEPQPGTTRLRLGNNNPQPIAGDFLRFTFQDTAGDGLHFWYYIDTVTTQCNTAITVQGDSDGTTSRTGAPREQTFNSAPCAVDLTLRFYDDKGDIISGGLSQDLVHRINALIPSSVPPLTWGVTEGDILDERLVYVLGLTLLDTDGMTHRYSGSKTFQQYLRLITEADTKTVPEVETYTETVTVIRGQHHQHHRHQTHRLRTHQRQLHLARAGQRRTTHPPRQR